MQQALLVKGPCSSELSQRCCRNNKYGMTELELKQAIVLDYGEIWMLRYMVSEMPFVEHLLPSLVCTLM